MTIDMSASSLSCDLVNLLSSGSHILEPVHLTQLGARLLAAFARFISF